MRACHPQPGGAPTGIEAPRFGRESGMTLVEATIVAVLTAVVLGAVYGSVGSVSTVAQKNNRELVGRSRQTRALERLQFELEQSGKASRYTIAPDGKSIRYKKLVGAEQVGSDVSGVWSSDWTIDCSASGTLQRWKSGWTETIATGIQDIRFVRNGDDSITITCTTERRGKAHARSITVNPRN